ncbi:hypothetical protein [Maricaulis maris]|uniref:Uncharacterized protein n=1 Tax=Maricaulis maris TaxID=74318 RepID=A0A495DM46_9PROT|nr:hypothetical protein [Maricaulis maris]RKR04003.1 hypothetical protein C7435_0446 [Maricaulis maris]
MMLQWTRRLLAALAMAGLTTSVSLAQSPEAGDALLAADRIPQPASSWSAVRLDADGHSRPARGLADGTLSLGADEHGVEALYRPADGHVYERDLGNPDYAVMEPAPRRPIYLDREHLRYLDVHVTAVSADRWQGEAVERLQLESRHSMTPEALSGEVVVTGDGIIVAADLSGTYAPEGQDDWHGWRGSYRLADLERGVDHDPYLFDWPETVAHLNAPG